MNCPVVIWPVLLDAQMPGVDGFKLAEQLADGGVSSVPIVMMLTSGDHHRRVTRCEELGLAAYLMKPLKLSELSDAIALVARAAAVVSNDSGLLHIASALNRPVLALYGPTDPLHAPPFSDMARSISLNLSCAPCRQRECPLGHQNCLRQIGSDMVWHELEPMLGARTAR